jgi:hypothetical protein
MIFTASDVSSLTGWEWGEYISEALVIVACAGELVADLGRKCLTKVHRDRVERLSTILLVAALSASLICLVRTNELSGNVIGSLGAKADEADQKAKAAVADSSTALSQAGDALTKAGKAQYLYGKTEDEASKAQAASSSALTLATGARREADSFEKDIASAKTQAADAESHLAEATKSANALTAKLERLTTPRSLPHSEQVLAPLKTFVGTEYAFKGTCGDEECFHLVSDIDELLKSAGWKRVKGPPMRIGITQFIMNRDKDFTVDESVATGIGISAETPGGFESIKALPPGQVAEHIRAAIALNQVLALSVSPSENTGKLTGIDTGTSTVVWIDIGRKPL